MVSVIFGICHIATQITFMVRISGAPLDHETQYRIRESHGIQFIQFFLCHFKIKSILLSVFQLDFIQEFSHNAPVMFFVNYLVIRILQKIRGIFFFLLHLPFVIFLAFRKVKAFHIRQIPQILSGTSYDFSIGLLIQSKFLFRIIRLHRLADFVLKLLHFFFHLAHFTMV